MFDAFAVIIHDFIISLDFKNPGDTYFKVYTNHGKNVLYIRL